jgi:hypothetical protein
LNKPAGDRTEFFVDLVEKLGEVLDNDSDEAQKNYPKGEYSRLRNMPRRLSEKKFLSFESLLQNPGYNSKKTNNNGLFKKWTIPSKCLQTLSLMRLTV